MPNSYIMVNAITSLTQLETDEIIITMAPYHSITQTGMVLDIASVNTCM